MARRRNDDLDLLELILKLVGVLFVLSLISPQVRDVIHGLGIIFIVAIVILAFVGLGFLLFKLSRRNHDFSNDAPNFQYQAYSNNTGSPVLPRQPDTSKVLAGDLRYIPPNTKLLTTDGLIEQLRSIDWFQFEKLVAKVFEKQGFYVIRRGGANPDGGIDLIIEMGDQKTAIQCKQWKSWNVGVKAIREFLGALTDANIQKGIFITLNGYTGEAKQLAEKHGIVIINEAGLSKMLEILDLAYDHEVSEILADTRKFCPKCERGMVLRTAEKGPNPGQQFWGCSGYPKCRYTMPYP